MALGIVNACGLVLWCGQSEFMAVLYGFNLWSIPGFIYFLVLWLFFNFSIALFLLLPIDLICSQVCILTFWHRSFTFKF